MPDPARVTKVEMIQDACQLVLEEADAKVSHGRFEDYVRLRDDLEEAVASFVGRVRERQRRRVG